MIEPGTKAPDFTLPNQDGEDVSLGDFAGRKLVLAFYPLDFSPVCTDQLSLYQEVLGEIAERGASLVGVSVDSIFCHARLSRAAQPDDAAARRLPPQGRDVARLRRLPRGPRLDQPLPRPRRTRTACVAWSYASPSSREIPGANLIFDALGGLSS